MSNSRNGRATKDASATRKRLLEAFTHYDALAKRIQKLPCPNGAGSSQERVQVAVMTRANSFLQKNMFSLQVRDIVASFDMLDMNCTSSLYLHRNMPSSRPNSVRLTSRRVLCSTGIRKWHSWCSHYSNRKRFWNPLWRRPTPDGSLRMFRL